MLVTEWDEFKGLDLPRIKESMRRPVFLDGRNMYDPGRMLQLGFEYIGVARGSTGRVNVAEPTFSVVD